MNTSPIQVVHSGVTITYNESANKFEFTLRGRDRSTDSLRAAREAIDKPVSKEKAKPFEKISAWFFKYDRYAPVKIEVTGIAENRGYGGGQQVWINHKGTRSKESEAFAIYPQSEKNDALISTILAKVSQVTKLREEVSELKQKLSPLVLPKDE